MSRIGKHNIIIPSTTQVTIADGKITVKGPNGELSREFRKEIKIVLENNELTLTPANSDIFTMALWGTYGSHLKNMVDGVTTPFVKKLVLEGVGYRAEVAGDSLNMSLGFSHPVKVKIPAGLKVTVEKGTMTITGIDKELVGQFSARIRSLKKPEPYKGKGFHYDTETVRRKQGKKSA